MQSKRVDLDSLYLEQGVSLMWVKYSSGCGQAFSASANEVELTHLSPFFVHDGYELHTVFPGSNASAK